MKTNRTIANVTIAADGPDAADMVHDIITALTQSGYIGARLEGLSKHPAGIAARMEFKTEYQVDPDYAEVPLKTATEAAGMYDETETMPKAENVVDLEQERAKAETKSDDCNCAACQLRRILFGGVDFAKAGSDRTAVRIFQLTPEGFRPIG